MLNWICDCDWKNSQPGVRVWKFKQHGVEPAFSGIYNTSNKHSINSCIFVEFVALYVTILFENLFIDVVWMLIYIIYVLRFID